MVDQRKGGIRTIEKQINSAINGVREWTFGSFDSGDYDIHKGVGLVEISNIFVTHDEFFYGTTSFDKV